MQILNLKKDYKIFPINICKILYMFYQIKVQHALVLKYLKLKLVPERPVYALQQVK